MCLFLGVQANVSPPWLVPLVHLSSLDYLLRRQATSLACTLRLYSFLIIYRVGYILSFATVVELTAITKSCVEREKSFGKIAQGTNCPYEEIFHNLWKNYSDHIWLVPLTVLLNSLFS